jgi:hypothetical protein
MSGNGHEAERTASAELGSQWEIYSASAIGADHVRAGNPNQDAVGGEQLALPRGKLPVLAVADGHGHVRHFRSDRGSRFGVAATTSVAPGWIAALADPDAPTAAEASELVTAIVTRWRELVAADLAADPLSAEQAAALPAGDPPEIPYGSTLLIAVLTAQVAVLGQVGDGEIVLVLADGRALDPVPTDSRLDGTRTTSLCQPDAVASFRVALVNLSKTPVFAVLAATDGYGNAQADENWRQALGTDLVRLASEQGTAWIGTQVGRWAAACASSGGSGDDSTVALALNSAVVLTAPERTEQQPAAAVRSATTGAGQTVRYEPTVVPEAGGPDQTVRYEPDAARPAGSSQSGSGRQPPPGTEPATRPVPAVPTSPPTVPVLTGPEPVAGPPPPLLPSAPSAQSGRSGLLSGSRRWLAGAVVVAVLAAVVVFVLVSRSSPGQPAVPIPCGCTGAPPPRTSPTTSPSTSGGATTSNGRGHRGSPATTGPGTLPSAIPTELPTAVPSGLPSSGSADAARAAERPGR